MKKSVLRSATFLLIFFGLLVSAIAQTSAKGFIGVALTEASGPAGGATVAIVKPGSPADQAGVKPGDIVVAINDTPVDGVATMTYMIGALAPNQIARLSVIRGRNWSAQRFTIGVVVGSPDGAAQPTATAAPPAVPSSSFPMPASNPSADVTSAPSSSMGTLAVSGYTHLTDPIEQSFTVDVPAGWSSAAGLARRSVLQINPYVRSLSPDKMTYLLIGEPTLPSFTPPSRMGNAIGYREGKLYDAGLGGLALVMRYLPGAEFARSYGQTMLKGLCPDLQFVGAQDRPDLARKAESLFPTVIPSRCDGGEARFTCTHNKQEMEVRVEAATRVTRDNVMWNVLLLQAVITPKGRLDQAEETLIHMGKSISFSPAWIQMQNNLSAQAAVAINRRMQEFFRQERKFIQNLNSVDENFSSMDEIISGFSTYHDERTGNDYSLSNTNPNKWIDDSTGRIISTPTNSQPGWGTYRLLPRAQ